jgi:CheY-like chemotaxis protein
VQTFALELATPLAANTGELAPGSYIVLRVQDTGHGMSAETLARAFAPFFTTKPPGAGTGLGLSTVYGVMLQCGGGIAARTALGRGSCFDLYFPIARRAPAVEQRDSQALEPPGGSETVLLVEDLPALCTALAETLRSFGYSVLPATTPDRALELLAQHAGELALLLTDVVMPKMGGRELAARVTQLAPQAKVLFMSGHTTDDALQRGVIDRTARLLQKPFSSQELARRVREVLDQP